SLFFFFSSRRRHTRSYGDWSSDVCSSDLFGWMSHKFTFGYDRAAESGEVFHPYGFVFQPTGDVSELDWRSETVTLDYAATAQARSEERRVGKECRSRWLRER